MVPCARWAYGTVEKGALGFYSGLGMIAESGNTAESRPCIFQLARPAAEPFERATAETEHASTPQLGRVYPKGWMYKPRIAIPTDADNSVELAPLKTSKLARGHNYSGPAVI